MHFSKWLGFRSFLAVAACLLLSVNTWSQGSKGAIRGRVTDPSGGALVGAQVTVQQNNASVVSDLQGEFFINNLDPGTYTVQISYVGFTTLKKEVVVAAGQSATVDAKLEVDSVNLEVLVTADRAAGEAEEINRQRTADNVVQVLSSDVIRSLPNANMADALGRLPSVTLERDEGEGKYVQVRGTEPRLTNLTINGINVPSPENNARQIKLDAIPADIVESVEINKTLQANMDADGIGGSVNLVTKTAGERPTIALSGMGGYTPIVNGRGLVETTGTVGQRFGRDKKLGALIGFSYDWNGRGIDDIEPVPDVNLNTGQRWFDSIDQREYRYYRSRWGLAGSTDYKLAEGSNVYFRGFYSDFKNFGDRWVYTLNDNTELVTGGATTLLNDPNGFGSGSPSAALPSFNTSIRLPDYAIASFVLGGKHVKTSTWYAWDVSVSRSRQLGENDPQATFGANLATSNCQFDPAATTALFRPQWTPACYTEAHNPANFSLSDINGPAVGRTAQLNLQFTAAMAKNYHLGSRLATFEFGGRFRNEHKYDDSFTPDFSVPSGVTLLPLNQFRSVLSNSDYYGGSYPLGPNPAYRDVLAAFNAAMPNALSTAGHGLTRRNYDLIERVSAGYLMNTVDLTNRIRIVAGVRFEGTNLDTRDPGFDSTGAFSGFVNNNGSYLNVLPSASVRVGVAKDTDLRVIYGRGLSRPNPSDIAQAVTFALGPPNTARLGNPNLKAETAQNFDLLIEHYINPFGEIQVGYFYKNLADPIVDEVFLKTFQPIPQAPLASYRVTQPINAGSGWVSGFEAAYLQHFSFMPGVLKGLGFSANYGYTASRAIGLPGRSDHPRLVRSAPNTWNVSPTYDRGRVSMRVGLSYNEANIFQYQFHDGTGGSSATPGGLAGPNSDVYLYTHLEIDAQGSVRMAHGLSFVAYGLNLNNEVFGFYQGSSQYMIQREYYRPTFAAGLRWSPREK